MPTDFLPFAIASGSNVDTQAAYAGAGYQQKGLQPGLVLSKELNKSIRQGSVMGAATANFIANTLSQPVLDNGDMATLITQLTNAIKAASIAANPGANPTVITIAYSPTPVFDCSLGNLLLPVFELQLTGNVTSSTIINMRPGQRIVFHIEMHYGGGWTFVNPVTVPGGVVVPIAPLDTSAGQWNSQSFDYRPGVAPLFLAATPLMLSI